MNHVHFESKRKGMHFFWCIFAIYAIVYMTKSCFSAAMASIVFEGVMTKSQTGLIIAMFYLFYTPMQAFGGAFADKYDPEKQITIGLIGAGIANLIIFFNQNYYVVLTVWIVNAVIQFGIWPSIFKIVSHQLPPAYRRNAIYYLSFSGTAGLMLAYFAAALIPKWHYNFAFSALSLFLCAILLQVISKKAKAYVVPDEQPETTNKGEPDNNLESIPVNRLFLESGFYIILVASFLRTIVSNSITTLSATMLMETYDGVTPSIGNMINVLVLGAGILGIVIAKKVLYPKHIKSAPTGNALMTFIALICSVFFMFIGKINLWIIVTSLFIAVGCMQSIGMFINYCTLRFEKFGKGGTVAGIVNAVSSFAFFVSSYGTAKLAELFDWTTVTVILFAMLASAFVLSVVVLPFWKRFKEKYHASTPHPLSVAK